MSTVIETAKHTLKMSRQFNVPRERVFAAWAEAGLMEKWWGCENTLSVKSDIDFRTGGSYRHIMQIRNAGEIVIYGTYKEIIEPEKIVFTMVFEANGEFPGFEETLVTVDFIEKGDCTELRLRQEGEPMEQIGEDVGSGWNASFDKLEKSLLS